MSIVPNALPIRELPCTFTLQIQRCGSLYAGTISNHEPFIATLHYTEMHKIDEIPCTLDQRTYDFMLWPDSYILIEYQGKTYKLDAQSAEEEVRRG